MFRERIYIKKTRGNRVFEFTPTNSIPVNRQFPQLFISYQRLLPIHSLEDLDDNMVNLMISLIEKNFINLKPTTLQAIDIIDTYCYDKETFNVIYLYDKDQNYLGKTLTCAPSNMFHQVINSRCKEAEYWYSSKDDNEEAIGKIFLPKYTKFTIKR